MSPGRPARPHPEGRPLAAFRVILLSFLLLLLSLSESQVALSAAVGSGASSPAQAAASPPPILPEGIRQEIQRALSILQVAADEYSLGVTGRKITNKAEYGEALQLSKDARDILLTLESQPGAPPQGSQLLERVTALLSLMKKAEAPDRISSEVLAAATFAENALGVKVKFSPPLPPSVMRGEALYMQGCASCHGKDGKGDPVLLHQLSPPPTNLATPEVFRSRSLEDLFRLLTVGVGGTAMPGYLETYSEQERWDLVAYLLKLSLPPSQLARGKQAFEQHCNSCHHTYLLSHLLEKKNQDLQPHLAEVKLSAMAPGDITPALAYARLSSVLREENEVGKHFSSIFATIRKALHEAERLLKERKPQEAQKILAAAYLDFEKVERPLSTKAGGMKVSLESQFLRLRTEVSSLSERDGAARISDLLSNLKHAEELLTANHASPLALFAQSFIIILREGFEAILIVAALAAYLAKSNHREKIPALYKGSLMGVAASILTALLFTSLFQHAVMYQELLEAITMLIATAVLFYVSYWLLAKVQADHWKAYIQGKLQDALTTGRPWALISVAFLAVYREGVETVLFYQALMGAAETGTHQIVGGFLAGLAALLIVYFLFLALEMKIPVRPLFLVTSLLLYLMAFIFMGKGVHELQEFGVLPVTPFTLIPPLEPLGIYPSLETFAGQLLLIFLLLLALVHQLLPSSRKRDVRAA